MTDQERLETMREILSLMADEGTAYGPFSPAEVRAAARDASATFDQLFYVFRSLVNTRPAREAAPGFLRLQDAMLQDYAERKGIVTLADTVPSPTVPHVYLWQGDITSLKTDAIVNAANKYMTGCWVPMHMCIDNAIHTFAGVQLRAQCDALMSVQGKTEPTGSAKVTPAYNLPSKWIIHTVGPIVAAGVVTATKRAQLASCYVSCLDAAAGVGATSIAFCCISTGVFGYPNGPAAALAVETVSAWLAEHADVPMDVVFNTFLDKDQAIYESLLGIA